MRVLLYNGKKSDPAFYNTANQDTSKCIVIPSDEEEATSLQLFVAYILSLLAYITK